VGIPEAEFEESNPDSPTMVITKLSCSLRGLQQEVLLVPGTLAAEAYGTDRAVEEFRCNYGLNDDYRDRIFSHGLRVSGTDAEGKVRIAESATHPFFMGTLFIPQLTSKPSAPHPLIMAFVGAAAMLASSTRTAGGMSS
jgi:CTP synthase (UTP-ammonia lyase)